MLNVKFVLILVLLIGSISAVSAHWYCPPSGVPEDYHTRAAVNYSTSYNSLTGNISLEVQAKICQESVWWYKSTPIYTTHWGFGNYTQVCTRDFLTGECGVGGYQDRRCVYHVGWINIPFPGGYNIFDFRRSTEADLRCAGGMMWVINRTITMKLSDYNNNLSGKYFSMAVQNSNDNNYKSYPSTPILLQSYVVNCSKDSDCGNNMCLSGENSCSGLNVVHDKISFTCNNPGTTSSYCSNETSQLLIGSCDYNCSLGKCFGI
ncbi:MAG: hypothetical protein ABH840_00235 [Nanoarchaeota archaeon]